MNMLSLQRIGRASALAGALMTVAFASSLPALAQGTLRIAMTSSDIPLPNGQTDQGAEGMRFMGYQVFEPLITMISPRPTSR
ncbi:exported hypothetical protein [Hyphomicrobiales bacterium]|nr:exported hypothetical protein [Hyphomicrobiales bacterium]CAH1695873.1 exported hypothetical protein [Hyphomicrobiales bacterium]